MGLIRRLLRGAVGLEVEAAEVRLEEARERFDQVDKDGDVLRARMATKVEEICEQTKRLSSRPPRSIRPPSVVDAEELERDDATGDEAVAT
jgi:hypothetical protein